MWEDVVCDGLGEGPLGAGERACVELGRVRTGCEGPYWGQPQGRISVSEYSGLGVCMSAWSSFEVVPGEEP